MFAASSCRYPLADSKYRRLVLFVLSCVDVTLSQSSLSGDEASLPTSTGLRRMDGVFQPFVHKFVSGLHRGLDCLITTASALRPAHRYHPPVFLLRCLTHAASLQLYRRSFLPRHFGIVWVYYCRLAYTMSHSLSVVLLLLYCC